MARAGAFCSGACAAFLHNTNFGLYYMNSESGEHLSEQQQVRINALKELIKLGKDPYACISFEVTSSISTLRETAQNSDLEEYKDLKIAGRVMQKRIMGNASFLELQDQGGRLQIYVNKKTLGNPEDGVLYNEVVKKLLDIGDIVGLEGFLFRTKTGELTLHAKELTILSKALRPFPIVKTDAQGHTHDAFSEPEQRHRMRYVDLTVNPERRQTVVRRAQLLRAMRSFLDDQGWLEVDTPILQPIHGGAAARPFKTFHNDLGIELYLRIANELYLKRMIVAGFDGVYEIGKMFRNEGIDRTHNPEFTSMELYVAYKDYHWMMSLVEDLLEHIALALHKTTKIQIGDQKIDFKGPYKRICMLDAIKQHAGVDVKGMDREKLLTSCKKLGIETPNDCGKAKLIDLIFGKYVEPTLIQPTFITDYPIETTPLAKKHRADSSLTERFELFMNKKEIANAYSELNDPIDQKERFLAQAELKQKGDQEAMQLDEDFIRALEFGMPPTAGLGIGIDRLLMLMTGEESIQEVLLFPQLKPKNN